MKMKMKRKNNFTRKEIIDIIKIDEKVIVEIVPKYNHVLKRYNEGLQGDTQRQFEYYEVALLLKKAWNRIFNHWKKNNYDYMEGVITDKKSNLNIAYGIYIDTIYEDTIELVIKTVMKKKNFKAYPNQLHLTIF